jgi:KRAB domain-containing zinc finger protein
MVGLKVHCVHTGECPNCCDVCNRTFSVKSNLKGHEHIHTGKGPYRCGVCSKKFSHKRVLKKHILSNCNQR